MSGLDPVRPGRAALGSIVVCGEALVDLTPIRFGDGEAYAARPGGSPYNVAIGLARLRAPVAFLGRLSGDHFGRVLRRRLVAEAVDARFLLRGPEPTTLAFVHPRRGGSPSSASTRTGASIASCCQRTCRRPFPTT